MDSCRLKNTLKRITYIFVIICLDCWVVFAENTFPRKQELQEKIVQCFPHGIPSRNLKDLSESDIPLLIELSEDPANARCRNMAFVALSHIQSKKSHEYFVGFYLKNVFTLQHPISNKEQMWLQDAVYAIPSCMGRLAGSGLDSSFDFLCQLSLPESNLALLDQHELSKQKSALSRQHLFKHGIHGLANCPTGKARSFLRQLVNSGSCKDYQFTYGETFQSYAERTLHKLNMAHYKHLAKWTGGCLALALIIYGRYQAKRRKRKTTSI